MSVATQIQQLQESSLHFLRQIVDSPAHHLFGRRGGSSGRQTGARPGTLFASPDAVPTRIQAFRIDDDGQVELLAHPTPEAISDARSRGGRLWVDVAGLADEVLIRRLAELFELHPVSLADLVNVEGQTKVDHLETYGLIIAQVPHLQPESGHPGLGQLGLALGPDWLLSFREQPSPLFKPIHARLERSTSLLRTQPLDYMACALLDVAVDSCFPIIETLADHVDELEGQAMKGSGNGILQEIHQQRRALITLGRLFWRQRDLMARLLRDEEIFRRETHIYLRDVHDRTVQLLDMVETTRELAASLVEIHLSISANRSNQIMKTLTIMASIFIPLTFVAGVYGMNFEIMPELAWRWGYPLILAVMLGIGLGLLLWFRHRGWLGDRT